MSDSLALSVVVVSFNMARELPRTILSLSPALQRDIAAEDYEIIVMDNGSADPPSPEAVRSWSANARLVTVTHPTVSPVSAINRGLTEARGALVGVFIDGARMASPRLLAGAVEAARIHPRAAVGTLAFHLGPDVQVRSILTGYDQVAEDRLLAASGWEQDPYRLFGLSVFAGSSAGGWFVVPAETNALFLTSAHWHELGGYDARFVSLGGGLANLDIWARVCADPAARVIMLMGEATFHQVHGGIATNSRQSPWDQFHAEYVAIRGKRYECPRIDPLFIGRPHAAAQPTLKSSLTTLIKPTTPSEVRSPTIGVPDGSGGLRGFDTAVPTPVLDGVQAGVLRSVYRGVPFLKSPFDIGLYMQLLARLQPRTVIEIGCKSGGAALWFADMLANHGVVAPRIISVDIDPPAQLQDSRIELLMGNAADLGACLTAEVLASCFHPWLVIEDSSHTYAHSIAVLEFFHMMLQPDDYIVIEDGVVAQLSGDKYARYRDGPNRAVAEFLSRECAHYHVDTALCDFYGRNATYNPNAWMRRL